MGPFAAGDHLVQKPPYWRANCTLGHLKQIKFKLSCFVLDVPVRIGEYRLVLTNKFNGSDHLPIGVAKICKNVQPQLHN